MIRWGAVLVVAIVVMALVIIGAGACQSSTHGEVRPPPSIIHVVVPGQ